MDLKHFSHAHPLAFHHLPPPPQGSQIHCSACKSPASANVYACWQCTYFLHQHCFHAARSLDHPSHPLHPLTLVPSPTYPSGSFFCNSCGLGGDGLSYSCSACEFDIHVHCALIPNHNPNSQPQIPIYPPLIATTSNDPPLPQLQTSISPSFPQPNITTAPVRSNDSKSETSMTKHFSHPHFLKPNEIPQKKAKLNCSACESDLSGPAYSCTEPHCSFNLHKACFDLPREVRHKFHSHPLTLLASPASSYSDEYTCDACQKGGKAFVYNCATCSFDLHIDCFPLPETVSRPDHDHPLFISTPVSESFMCGVCKKYANEKEWVYNCSDCDFGTHLECVHSEIEPNVSEEEEEETGDITDRLFKLQQQQTHNIIRMQMAQQNAQFMNSLANSWRFY
ncbi:hypothetical protein ACS0TY_020320 [Phlomoides rotata]